VTEDNVTTREDQDDCRNEECSRRRKSSAGTKDRTTGSVGAPIGKGITVGHGNQHREIMSQTYRLGGG
jgi:hypothetical protein